ncbi:helix-turn-helix domain-containing protein [Duganella lactea]
MSTPPKTLDARQRFASNLRRWRMVRGITQQYVAEHSGLSRVYISKVENSSASVSIDAMEKIAIVLSIDVAELLAL